MVTRLYYTINRIIMLESRGDDCERLGEFGVQVLDCWRTIDEQVATQERV